MEAMTCGPLVWTAATRALPGESVSGDRCVVKRFSSGILLAAIDGLGHGREAADASKAAVQILDRHAGEPVLELIQLCHEELRGTRGVVMSLASLTIEGALHWVGIGNVEGLLVRADAAAPHESLSLRGGIVGRQLPPPHVSFLRLTPRDLLLFATDGVSPQFFAEVRSEQDVGLLVKHIIARHWKETDDALVLAARYEGWKP
jgi:negative regulator of sigma-B (phosphoserine phosphatase)